MPVFDGKKRIINDRDDVNSLVEHMLKDSDKTVSVIIPIDFLEMIQARVEVSEETVHEYRERMELGDNFPDVEVVISPEKFEVLCYNGFHRKEATKLLGKTHINATVRLGTREDAEILAAGANAESIKPRTSEDKRSAVKLLLGNPTRAAWSNNRLAKLAKVSPPLVEEVRQQLEEAGLVARPAKRQAIRNGKLTSASDPYTDLCASDPYTQEFK